MYDVRRAQMEHLYRHFFWYRLGSPTSATNIDGHPRRSNFNLQFLDSSCFKTIDFINLSLEASFKLGFNTGSFGTSDKPSSTGSELEKRPSISYTMVEPSSSTTDKGRITDPEDTSMSSKHSNMRPRSFRIEGTYTTITSSTLRRFSEPDDFDLEQLDLEDFEDLDSDDCESCFDLENFESDEIDLDMFDLDALDDEDRRTLMQWLEVHYNLTILYQGRQISKERAFQIVTRNDTTTINTITKPESDGDTSSIATKSEDSNMAESNDGGPPTKNDKGSPVIDGDDWKLWCEG
ncbi:hypothetical protein IWZ01DRAFT_483586 [Phyllosticta capitalensis]